jgi:hypothetical protein
MIWRRVVFFDLPLLGKHFIDASIQGLIVCDRGNVLQGIKDFERQYFVTPQQLTVTVAPRRL